MMRPQQSDSIFDMAVDVMRAAFNLEPKSRVTMLGREEWTRETAVKGIVWFTDGSRTKEETGAGVYGQTVGRKLSISLGKYATIIQARANQIQTNVKPGKYVSICSDSQAAQKTLHTARTTTPLVRRCQKTLNDISTRHTVGCIGSLDTLGYEEMKSLTSSQDRVLFRSS